MSQGLKHGQCLHIEGRRRASHSDPAQAGRRGKHRARMQNSRGLGLAEAQVTDYGLGSVREAGGYHITEDPELQCEEAAFTL